MGLTESVGGRMWLTTVPLGSGGTTNLCVVTRCIRLYPLLFLGSLLPFSNRFLSILKSVKSFYHLYNLLSTQVSDNLFFFGGKTPNLLVTLLILRWGL